MNVIITYQNLFDEYGTIYPDPEARIPRSARIAHGGIRASWSGYMTPYTLLKVGIQKLHSRVTDQSNHRKPVSQRNSSLADELNLNLYLFNTCDNIYLVHKQN